MTESLPKWTEFLENNKWTTYLAYQLKNSKDSVNILLNYEALLTQCSYLSRMAYCPADIFCRMTNHLDITPNAFNNYIRAIEKIYDRLFNYKCSFDSNYIQKHPEFEEYFNSIPGGDILAPQKSVNSVGIVDQNNSKAVNTGKIPAEYPIHKKVEIVPQNNPGNIAPAAGGAELNNSNIEDKSIIGFFVQNKEHMNVYLYVYCPNENSKFNTKKTLFITFKGSSSIEDFRHDLKSAAFPDKLLSELSNAQNTQETVNSNSNAKNKKNKPGKAGYGFIKSLKPSIQDICKKIEKLKIHEYERVIITGHSLGGALASLFGYYLKKYNPNLIDKPIHVVTFGACCVFDAVGRNEFNAFLNIEDGNPVFTLDRVTSNLDPIIVLPVDLDHPGFTIPRDEFYSYKNTKRTKEIGELRDLLGLKEKKGIDLTADDLLSTEDFVKLFSNFDALKVNGHYDEELYKKKFLISFGTDAEEQYPILHKAMPDAKLKKIQELFKSIETRKKNKLVNIPETKAIQQEGGLYNPLSKGSNATKAYKKEAEKRIPNQIQYSCYAKMTFRFCHASYMGVSYVMVLRLPNISEGKLRKEPTKDYTLYQKYGRILSLPLDSYKSNGDCTKVESNKNRKNNKPRSWKNKLTGIFKSENINKKEKKPLLKQLESSVQLKDIGGIFSKCSIL
jgi:hypothetical protein